MQSEPMVISISILLLKAMPGAEVLLQPGSLSVSMDHFATEGQWMSMI